MSEQEKVDLSPDAHALADAMAEQDLRRFIRAEVRKALDELAEELRRNNAFQTVRAEQR